MRIRNHIIAAAILATAAGVSLDAHAGALENLERDDVIAVDYFVTR